MNFIEDAAIYIPNIVGFITSTLLRTVFITCITLLLIVLWVGFYNYVICAHNPRQRYRIRWRNFRAPPPFLVVNRFIDDALIIRLGRAARRNIGYWWDGRRPVRIRGNNYLERRQNRLSQTEFKRLPKRVMSRKLMKELNLATEPECVICMEKISNRQHMSIPCSQKHYFHIKCSRNWLTQKCKEPTCPICRENIRNRNRL